MKTLMIDMFDRIQRIGALIVRDNDGDQTGHGSRLLNPASIMFRPTVPERAMVKPDKAG